MSWQILTPGKSPAQLARAFDAQSIGFCAALGDSLRNDPACRDYPDLAGLAFWLRPAQLQRMITPYRSSSLKPLGRVMHYAPSNVDSFFVYTALLSLLCGNINWVRLSQRSSGSVTPLTTHIQKLQQAFPDAHARLQLIRCEHDDKQLSQLQRQCDARVIWGSERSVQALRAQPVSGHTRDLCFSHKSSLALLDAQAVLQADAETLERLANDFLRDTLTFAQQACTSPRTLAWLGESALIGNAQHRFWNAIAISLREKPWLDASDAMSAFSASQLLAMQPEAEVTTLALTPLPRLQIQQMNDWQHDVHPGSGLLLEVTVNTLAALTPQLKHHHQTLSHWGVASALLDAWLDNCLTGLDRVVPIGQALQFTPLWDGMDLILQLSRQTHYQMS